MDDGGRPSAELLEERLKARELDGLCFYAFDLLHYEEFDLRGLPLVERKAALRAMLPQSPHLLFVDHVTGSGRDLVRAVSAAGLPSVIGKRAGSAYTSGASEDWVRIPVDGDAGAHEVAVDEALERTRAERKPSRVTYSNVDKVYWPAEGYTKGDLLAWYERVADVMLPYLRERPMHMYRFPDGIEGKSFYQKDTENCPDWIETTPIEVEGRDEVKNYLVCNDRDTLLWVANMGSIDLHPWFSRRGSLDSPDWTVLDLDPKEAPFSDVVRIARTAGKLLRGIGLRPLLKTSGKTGLHIYVPLQPGYTYDHSRMFCESVARIVAREHADIGTVERAISSREGKVYLDFGQNRREQTIAPPYSVRPVRGAQVSTPLHWDELDSDLSPSLFTIHTVGARLEQHGDLFRPTLTDPQDLMPAIEKLQEILAG